MPTKLGASSVGWADDELLDEALDELLEPLVAELVDADISEADMLPEAELDDCAEQAQPASAKTAITMAPANATPSSLLNFTRFTLTPFLPFDCLQTMKVT